MNSEPQDIEEIIKTGFLEMDARIMGLAESMLENPNLALASSHAVLSLTPVLSGSCALFCTYDPSTSMLHVANVGDSRAVLGRCDWRGDYSPIPLSVDQTGFNPAEVARITSEHPADENVIDKKTGRMHGLAVTRAFGDARWKWTGGTL